jgi:uncharacterized repeat protein (TIGR01451 family)
MVYTRRIKLKKILTYFVSRGLTVGLLAAGPSLFGQIALTMNSSEPNPVAGGLFFSYTITATNTGSTGPMTVNDFLPAGVQFLSVSSTASSLAAHVICSGPPIGTSGSVTCSSPAFPAGAVATITILAQCAPNVSGLVDNVADAIPIGPPFPERASFLQRVKTEAVLQLFSRATERVSAGGDIVYDLIALNAGVSSVGVVVEDQIPDSTSFVSVTGTTGFHDGCSFQPATNKVQCFAKELPTGGGEITIVVRTSTDKKQGAVVNTATLQAAGGNVTGSPATSTTVLQ